MAVAIATAVSLVATAPPSAAMIGDNPVASPPTPTSYTHQASTNTAPFDLPGGALGLSLAQGERVWLYTTGLKASTTYANELPDPGVTFIVQCYGPGLASGGTGWYVGRNLDTPRNTYTFTPQIRSMFVAPSTGAYTCKIRIAAYQPRSDIRIPVTFHAGASLHATPVKPTSSLGVTAGHIWSVPSSSTQPVIGPSRPKIRHNYGNYIFERSSSPKVTIIMDQNVTTCAPGDSFPGCVAGTSGTEVTTTLVVHPQHLDGTPCGTSTAFPVFTHTLRVITPYHHYPLLNTAVLDKATDLYGCPRLNMALDLTWRSGAPMVVHTFRPND
ncbi:MAG TPA: hypothetical protein VFV66_08000, partial [Nonomuraea sp.]|nr:hypothetical protein [Nonomuraea sp.]